MILFLIVTFAVMIFALLARSPFWAAGLDRFCAFAKVNPVMCIITLGALIYVVAWGGQKGDRPPVVTERGIVLESVEATANSVRFKWRSEDDRIRPGAIYLVQRRVSGDWLTVGTTADAEYLLEGFTVDRDNIYRIAVDITEDAK